MLTIRLQRVGRKHEPTFRVVLTDSKNGPKSGKYLENLGWYDSRRKNSLDQLDVEQIKHWLSKGAQTSVTIHNFLVSHKVISGKKLNALPRKSPIKKEGEADASAAAPVTPAATEAALAPAAAAVPTTEAAPEAAPVSEAPASPAQA